MKKHLIIGLGPVVDKNWRPVIVDRAGALRITEKLRSMPMFTASVCDCVEYWRGNYGAQTERRGVK